MIHIGLAREVEGVWAGFATVRIAKPIVGFHTDHDTPGLHVVAGLTAGQITAELRANLRAERHAAPILIDPRSAGVEADVGASPVIAVHHGRSAVLDAAGRTGGELVARARVDCPTLDVLADAIIDAGVTQPTGVGECSGRAEAELAIVPTRSVLKVDLSWVGPHGELNGGNMFSM